MVRAPNPAMSPPAGGEKLIVKWRTQGSGNEKKAERLYRGVGKEEQMDRVSEVLGKGKDGGAFTGLFIFEFDEEGRIGAHTIEHADEGTGLERVGWVGLTDWLLSKVGKGKKVEEGGLVWGFEARGR